MATSRLEMSKVAKFKKTLLFLKKELNSNWLETLRIKWNHWESLLYLNREWLRPFIIQDMSYDYKKIDKYSQKLKICTKSCARKLCPPNQLNIKLITKNKKNLGLHFIKVTTFVFQITHIIEILWKKKQKPTTKGQICKNHENWFYENWLFQEERPIEENKTVMKSKLYFNR